jgi:hypothetical protein
MTTVLRCDLQERKHQTVETSRKYILVRNKLNTPVIIKFPFWEYTKKNPNAFYACINLVEAGCSRDIVKRSVCIDAGVGDVLEALGV